MASRDFSHLVNDFNTRSKGAKQTMRTHRWTTGFPGSETNSSNVAAMPPSVYGYSDGTCPLFLFFVFVWPLFRINTSSQKINRAGRPTLRI